MSEEPKKPLTTRDVADAYAQAVIKVAEENYTYKEWGETLRNVANFVKDKDVQEILRHPDISPDDIVDMVADLLKKADASEPETKFIMTLTMHGRLPLMPLISMRYDELSRAAMGIRDVHIVSAEKLSLQDEVKIKKMLKTHFKIKADITKTVDPDLIAGFTIRFDGKFIDQSTRGYRERVARMNNG